MKNIFFRAGTVVVATVLLAAPVGAQTSGGASRAVFGGARPGATDGQDLNLSIDLSQAYDQDVLAGGADASHSLFQSSGAYATLTPQMDFSTHGGRVQLGVTAGSSARYYQELHELVVMSHTAGAGLTAALTPHTSVSLNQSVAYSPALFNGLFANVAAPALGDTASPSANYAMSEKRSYSYGTTAGLTHKFSGRLTAVLKGGYHYDHFTGQDPGYADVRSQDVGGQFAYTLSRDLKLRVGYTFRQGQYQGLPRTTEHDGDIGIDYSRPLSRTRRTSIAISLGPAAANGALTNGVVANGSAPTGTSLDVRRQYRLVSDMSLVHQAGRTWNLRGTYHRGMGYIQGFQGPVFTAAYATSAEGMLNRRTDLSLSAAYSTGDSALTGAASPFTTYTGDARLRFAVNRTFAAYVDYVFYYYDIGPGTQLPLGVPPGLTRNGVRTGLTMWIPVRHR